MQTQSSALANSVYTPPHHLDNCERRLWPISLKSCIYRFCTEIKSCLNAVFVLKDARQRRRRQHDFRLLQTTHRMRRDRRLLLQFACFWRADGAPPLPHTCNVASQADSAQIAVRVEHRLSHDRMSRMRLVPHLNETNHFAPTHKMHTNLLRHSVSKYKRV